MFFSIGDDTAPSQTFGQPMTRENATNVAEEAQQIPLRFFSNGFTVGDGELRRFEDNQQFMEHIKRGEVPPELRNLTSGGRHVEVKSKFQWTHLFVHAPMLNRFDLKITAVKNTNRNHQHSRLSSVRVICLAHRHQMLFHQLPRQRIHQQAKLR